MKTRMVKKRHRGVDITIGDYLIEFPQTYGMQARFIKEDLEVLHKQAVESIPAMMKLFPKGQKVVISWQARSVPKSRRPVPRWRP